MPTNICRVRTRDTVGNYYTYIVIAETLVDAEVKIKAFLAGCYASEDIISIQHLPIMAHGVAVVDAHMAVPAPF